MSLTFSDKRVYGLDILRAAAILFVVYGHTAPFLLKIWPHQRWLSMPVFDGVSIFFVLSGFLIGGILIKNLESEKASLPLLVHFWIRRWYRTLPNYFLILILLFIGQGLVLGKLGFETLWKYVFFAQNFTQAHPVFFPEAWSLSIEEWFYILIPISLFVLARLRLKPKWALLLLIIFVVVLVTYIRLDTHWDLEKIRFKEWDKLFRKRVITRLDSLMIGVMGAWMNYYLVNNWLRLKKAKFVLGVLLMLFHKLMTYYRLDMGLAYNTYYTVWSFTLISISTFLVIPYLSQLKAGSGFWYKRLTIISLISYSMYLINLTALQEVFLKGLFRVVEIDSFMIKNLLSFFLVWILTISISIVIYKYFEQPIMRKREKYSLEKIRLWFNKRNTP